MDQLSGLEDDPVLDREQRHSDNPVFQDTRDAILNDGRTLPLADVGETWPEGLDGFLLHRLHCREDRCCYGCDCLCHGHDGLYPASLELAREIAEDFPDVRVQIVRSGDSAGAYVDTRDQRTKVADHERLRVNRGALLAARLGPDQSVPPFPPQGYPGDCGLDLATDREFALAPGQSDDVPCGVAVALPPGTFGYITGRSSTWTRWGLWVMPGVIDEGWRGELRTLVHRPWVPGPQDDLISVPRGTRLAQLIVLPNLISQVTLWRVLPGELPPHERGERGFGSTG